MKAITKQPASTHGPVHGSDGIHIGIAAIIRAHIGLGSPLNKKSTVSVPVRPTHTLDAVVTGGGIIAKFVSATKPATSILVSLLLSSMCVPAQANLEPGREETKTPETGTVSTAPTPETKALPTSEPSQTPAENLTESELESSDRKDAALDDGALDDDHTAGEVPEEATPPVPQKTAIQPARNSVQFKAGKKSARFTQSFRKNDQPWTPR